MEDLSWLDRNEYPFRSRFVGTPEGNVHYLDEGEGEVLLFLHGNPTWSFMYRELFRHFSSNGFRCLAVDYLGFGLSDKPEGIEYVTQLHTRHITQLIEELQLENITIVIHDWGGPIGMSYAVDHPENVKRLIVLNTWFWSLKGKLAAELYTLVLGGPVGRFLCRQFNAFPRFIMPLAFGRREMAPHIHQHYTKPFPSPGTRDGQWMFVRAVTGESEWLDSIWAKREGLRNKPMLILWALDDPVFKLDHLEQWQKAFPDHRLETFPRVGHFIAEEAGRDLVVPAESFLRDT